MFLIEIFKKGFLERLAIKYLNRKSSNLEKYDKCYKVTSFYNPEPDYCFKGGFFGRIKMIPKHGHSRLEEISKEELDKALEKFKEIEKCSEDRENERI